MGTTSVRRGRVLRSVAAVLVAPLLVLGACSRPEPAPEPTTAAPPPTTAPTPSATPTPAVTAQPVDPLPSGAVEVLLVGSDSRDPQDLTGNADTIMVMHLPADRSALYLVSFTRDMWVDIPRLGEGKINSAFARGGTRALQRTVERLLDGTDVEFVVQSNFAGFIALTRALDGFEVDNRHRSTVTVTSTGRVVTFPEGRIRLENTDGLIYVRERKRLPLGDLDRAERQRAAVVGIMARLRELAADPAELTSTVAMLHRNVKITGDFSVDQATGLAPLLGSLGRDDVVSLMAPVTGFGNRGGASVNLVDTAQMAALGEAMRTDTMAAYVERYGTDYAP